MLWNAARASSIAAWYSPGRLAHPFIPKWTEHQEQGREQPSVESHGAGRHCRVPARLVTSLLGGQSIAAPAQSGSELFSRVYTTTRLLVRLRPSHCRSLERDSSSQGGNAGMMGLVRLFTKFTFQSEAVRAQFQLKITLFARRTTSTRSVFQTYGVTFPRIPHCHRRLPSHISTFNG